MPAVQTWNMKKTVLVTLLCALAAASSMARAGAAGYEMKSYVVADGQTQEAAAWCDAPDRIIGVVQPASANLKQPQPTKLRQVLKRPAPNTDAFDYVAEYLLGPSEGAAGSVYSALIPPGRTPHSDAASQYYLRLSNVENTADPAYRMSRVNEFRTPEGAFRCRYVKDAAFMGVTNKRTVIIWDNGKTVTYATHNFDGTPGVYITEGRKRYTTEGGTGYEFKTTDGHTYGVMIDEYRPASGAKLSVYKAQNLKLSEKFLAYSISLPKVNK